MNPFLLLVIGYLMGSTPTSFWVGRALGVDLRTVGSGNLGATNAFRVLGGRAALPVVAVDVAKGWLPARAFPLLDVPEAGWGWALAYGGAAILGHVFSVWVRFRGGKGVATSAGVFLALAPWALLVAFLVFATTAVSTRLVSLASILAAVALPFAVATTPLPAPVGSRSVLVAFTGGLALFVVWAHRSNLGRLLRGEETPIDEDRHARRGRPDGKAGEGTEWSSEGGPGGEPGGTPKRGEA